MMKISALNFMMLMALCLMGLRHADATAVYGLDRMERFDLLPYLLEGTQVQQVSSYDRSGGNDDGFNGTYSSLYVDSNDEYVLFDEMGAGCLYRFWMTYGSSPADYASYRLRFYFDNEVVPRLDMSIAEFFDGVGAPLEFPLVGPFNESSHGCYCYVPFPYRERLKITLSGSPLFYNMTYHRFDSADGIDSWTGTEDQSAVLAQWNAVGSDPKPAVSNLVATGNLSLPAGTNGMLFSVTGSGTVQSIKLDPSPATPDVLSNVRIQMDWDGGIPAVDVPLGDFFGSGKYEINVASLPIGMNTSGDWYCYFPMPYWESAEIRLVNTGHNPLEDVTYTVVYTTNAYDRLRAGYFHAWFNEESFVNNGTDFNFIRESGRGHVVGISLFMESSGAGGYRDMNYLEGDERAYVDGSATPCIHGTGNEDYFNCGWYFNQGRFSRPYHGHPWADQFNEGATNFTQAYRFHLSDIIPFDQSVEFGIEHGPANQSPGNYSSVAYYYKMAGTASGLELVADLDLGDTWSESMYDYQPVSGFESVSNAWRYEGDHDGVLIADTGYSYSGTIAGFAVPVPDDCNGLLIRRRTDQGTGPQKSYVLVDDEVAGIWAMSDQNFSLVNPRWKDAEFRIASDLVAGKESVQIDLVPAQSGTTWNEYRYRIYSVKADRAMLDTDKDTLPDAWEFESASVLTVLDGAQDSDDDGFSDREEFIAGTDPLMRASHPMLFINGEAGEVGTPSRLGRLYHLQHSESLVSNNWVTVRSAIPGNGDILWVPCSMNGRLSYYRFLVEKP